MVFWLLLAGDVKNIKEEQELMQKDIDRILGVKESIDEFNNAYTRIIDWNKSHAVPRAPVMATGN